MRPVLALLLTQLLALLLAAFLAWVASHAVFKHTERCTTAPDGTIGFCVERWGFEWRWDGLVIVASSEDYQ